MVDYPDDRPDFDDAPFEPDYDADVEPQDDPFEAVLHSICPYCDESVQPGQLVVKVDYDYYHEECA